MSRLLDDGHVFCDPASAIDAEQLRSWASRLGALARDLADCLELPTGNRVMETLYSSSGVPDHANALYVLRLNVAGQSPGDFAAAAGVSWGTITSAEQGTSCRVKSAAAIADQFALGVLELFDHEDDTLTVRTVGALRDALTSRTARN
jgi:hypothetical protein